MTHLDTKALDRVAALAHLELTEDEKQKYLPQLQAVLDSMGQIDHFDLSVVEPAMHSTVPTLYIREDEKETQADDLLKEKNAPAFEKGGFKVPKILGESV